MRRHLSSKMSGNMGWDVRVRVGVRVGLGVAVGVGPPCHVLGGGGGEYGGKEVRDV
jgi:hypothetical protein